jgi:hypothetical protein
VYLHVGEVLHLQNRVHTRMSLDVRVWRSFQDCASNIENSEHNKLGMRSEHEHGESQFENISRRIASFGFSSFSCSFFAVHIRAATLDFICFIKQKNEFGCV